jgi:hypothetical protein
MPVFSTPYPTTNQQPAFMPPQPPSAGGYSMDQWKDLQGQIGAMSPEAQKYIYSGLGDVQPGGGAKYDYLQDQMAKWNQMQMGDRDPAQASGGIWAGPPPPGGYPPKWPADKGGGANRFPPIPQRPPRVYYGKHRGPNRIRPMPVPQAENPQPPPGPRLPPGQRPRWSNPRGQRGGFYDPYS